MTVQQYGLFGGATDLTPIEAKVERVLATYPETRGLDKNLIVKLWLEEDGLAEVLGDAALVDRFAEWFTTRATYTESITRARRSIQAGGRYLPEPKHQARRNGRQQQYHDRYRRR